MKIKTILAPPYNMILILEVNELLSKSELLNKIYKSFSNNPNFNQLGYHHLLLITLEDTKNKLTNLHPVMYVRKNSPSNFYIYSKFVNKTNPNWYENNYKKGETNWYFVYIMNIDRMNFYIE